MGKNDKIKLEDLPKIGDTYVVDNRNDFNVLLRKHLIPFLISIDQKEFVSLHSGDMFSKWDKFFVHEGISVSLMEDYVVKEEDIKPKKEEKKAPKKEGGEAKEKNKQGWLKDIWKRIKGLKFIKRVLNF